LGKFTALAATAKFFTLLDLDPAGLVANSKTSHTSDPDDLQWFDPAQANLPT